jgi:hypothetical protein
MNRFMRIILMCVAFFYPLGNAVAQEAGGPVAMYNFPNYELGKYDPNEKVVQDLDSGLVEMQNISHTNSVAEISIIGRADATPWKSCKGNKDCSALKNQTLAELRASTFARMLSKKYGIEESHIYSRGEVIGARGGEFRGVTVYIRRRAESVSQNATAIPNSTSEVASLRSEVADLRDSVTVLSHRNTVPSSAPAQPTSPVEMPTNIAPKETTTVYIEPPVHIDVGVGVAGVKTNHTDALAPMIGIYLKPRASPVEFFLEGGYRPSSSSNRCNRADVIGTLGAHYKPRSLLGLSGGLFTAREMCTNGGPKLNERWLDRTNGVFLGPTFNFHFMSLPISINPALTRSSTYNAQTDRSKGGWGLIIRGNIRFGSDHKR